MASFLLFRIYSRRHLSACQTSELWWLSWCECPSTSSFLHPPDWLSNTWIKPAFAAPSGDHCCDSGSLLADEWGERNSTRVFAPFVVIPLWSSGWCLSPVVLPPRWWSGGIDSQQSNNQHEFLYFSASLLAQLHWKLLLFASYGCSPPCYYFTPTHSSDWSCLFC